MKLISYLSIFIFITFLLQANLLDGQTVIKGEVLDDSNDEALIRATIQIKGDAWLNLDDPWSLEAIDKGGNEGFLPFETADALPDKLKNNAPWDFWSPDLDSPPIHPAWWPLDIESAKETINKAISFFAPRACITLGLDFNFSEGWWLVDIDEVLEQKINLQVFPNPASATIHFTSKEYPMEFIKIYDLMGRLVKEYQNIKEYTFEMQKGNLGNGVYFAQVWFEDGFLSKQIIFQD